jgi:hypothetical protein
MLLNKEQILSSQDLKTEQVDVPEWSGSILIGTMTGAARDAWEQSLVGQKGKANIVNIRARLIAACAVDESGNRLFSDDDAEALGKKSAAALDRCAKVAQKLNRLTEADLEDAKGN